MVKLYSSRKSRGYESQIGRKSAVQELGGGQRQHRTMVPTPVPARTSINRSKSTLSQLPSQLSNLCHECSSQAPPFPFFFAPVYDQIVVGGAINGQVVAWDIARALHTIDQRKRKQSVRHIGKPSPGADEDEPVASLPPVKPSSISHIDMSHRRLVADLAWLPPTTQVRAMLLVALLEGNHFAVALHML